MDAPGLAEKVANGNAIVRVCKQECVYNKDDSSATAFSCAVPEIATSRSNELFKIKDEEHLRATLPDGQSIENIRTVIGGADG